MKSCSLDKKQLFSFYLMCFLWSLKLLLEYFTVCYKLSMSFMLTIFDVSIKEKWIYGSICFELLPHQMSQIKKKYMDLCQHANKYKQVLFETLSWTLNDIWRVTYVTWFVK